MGHRTTLLAGLAVLFGMTGLARGDDVQQLLEKRTYKDADGKALPYRLLKPDGYDPGKKYPLVLFLHGAGERGDDNEKQLLHGVAEFAGGENRKKHPCFLAAPQCPAGAKWVDIDWSAETQPQPQPEKIAEPLRLALELTDSLQKEFSVDAGRVYVTGLSMGGYGTWDAIARRLDSFAAAVPVCGGGDPSYAGRIAKLPIWAFHGAKDPVVRPQRSLEMVAALMKAGGAPGYTQYPDVGHDSWVPAYREAKLFEWLFAQQRK